MIECLSELDDNLYNSRPYTIAHVLDRFDGGIFNRLTIFEGLGGAAEDRLISVDIDHGGDALFSLSELIP